MIAASDSKVDTQRQIELASSSVVAHGSVQAQSVLLGLGVGHDHLVGWGLNGTTGSEQLPITPWQIALEKGGGDTVPAGVVSLDMPLHVTARTAAALDLVTAGKNNSAVPDMARQVVRTQSYPLADPPRRRPAAVL